MKKDTSTPERLARIKYLAEKYFQQEKGVLIARHEELLHIVDILGQNCMQHPHREYMVYISRKALKHFVESRSSALKVRHTNEETLAALHFAIDKIPDVIMDYDRHEEEPKHNPPKYFYSKDYPRERWPSIRILVEEKEEKILEIRSIHFQTRNPRR